MTYSGIEEITVQGCAGRVKRWIRQAIWICAALLCVASLWRLENERATVSEKVVRVGSSEFTLYEASDAGQGPLVMVTHGFAGSLQMMQYISRDLARAGFTVAAFDFYGHGSNSSFMSPDVRRVEGTTQQLVAQTIAVTSAAQRETGLTGPVALIGHSMATDIVIRAAEDLREVSAIVAISMHSQRVTESFPKRLLILSGAWESRLRDVARKAVALVGGAPVEGTTVRRDDTLRRAISVPGTEHVAVLFDPVTCSETRLWLQQAFDMPRDIDTISRGLDILIALGALVLLVWPLSHVLSLRPKAEWRLETATYFKILLLPIIPASVLSVFIGSSLLGAAAFGSLVSFSVFGAL